jgi:hypothetical protein
MIRNWLANCLQGHDWCNAQQTGGTSFVPDRLLHVASISSIHLSNDHPPGTSYLALSYCWGTRSIFSTTRENFSDHLENIPWSMLPTTFQHAIEITRSLGYKYIWIDSVCIIQHDAEDFANQSRQMGDIYSNAILVIAADLARSVHEGIHRQRQRPTTIVSIPTSKRTLNRRSTKVAGIRHVDAGPFESTHDLVHSDLETIYANGHFKSQPKYDEKHHLFRSSSTKDRAWVRVIFYELFIEHKLILTHQVLSRAPSSPQNNPFCRGRNILGVWEP